MIITHESGAEYAQITHSDTDCLWTSTRVPNDTPTERRTRQSPLPQEQAFFAMSQTPLYLAASACNEALIVLSSLFCCISSLLFCCLNLANSMGVYV